MNLAAAQRQAAEEAAKHFRANVLMRIGMVLEDHTAGLIDFMCETQLRLDRAEALLAEVAQSRVLESESAGGLFRTIKVRDEAMYLIEALLNDKKARTE